MMYVMPLFCRMQILMKAGKPLVFTQTLPVLENKWYGTQGGFNVQASEVHVASIHTIETCETIMGCGFEAASPASRAEAETPSLPRHRGIRCH